MKKIISFLLILTFLLSMIYVPSVTVDAATGTAADAFATDELLPDGTRLYPGSIITTGATAIKTLADFKTIKPGGSYYLAANIDLRGYTNPGGGQDVSAITLDGRGYTVTVDRPIFKELPPNSRVYSLIIDGTISVASSTVTGSEYAAAAVAPLVCKSYGGKFENIVNRANINVEGSSAKIRIAGIVGTVYFNDIIIQNCVNKGNLVGSVGGDSGYCMGGILAYSGITDTAKSSYLIGCKNVGNITNNATSIEWVSAGGILGIKQTNTKCRIINCSNKGTLTAEDYKGAHDGCTAKTFTSGLTYVKTATPISTASELINLSGSGAYYLTQDIDIGNAQNSNGFTGTLYCSTRKITSNYPPFANMASVTFDSKNIPLSGWTPISDTTGFAAITAGKKYYLTGSFTYTGATLAGGNNTAAAIVIDGCGYTITTNKMLIEQLPGGNGTTMSQIRNLTIAGTLDNVSSTTIQGYGNGDSHAALVGKANGGIFKNVINTAHVTQNIAGRVRVAGLIGSIHNAHAIIDSCQNQGNITGIVTGKADGDKAATDAYGVGGLVGYVGGNGATFYNCKNTGTVKNTSAAESTNTNITNDGRVYAGGVICTKGGSVKNIFFIDCVNTGAIGTSANTECGQLYCVATDTASAFLVYNSTGANKNISVVSSADDFAKISGSGNYVLTRDIFIDEQNDNAFSGIIWGLGYTVTSSDGPIFGNAINASKNSINQKLDSEWTAISDAAGFKAIANGKKYYLTANIDLTASGVNFTTIAGGSNTAAAIALDGCGYKITTNKMLIDELPGGGSFADGTHSIIRNLVISGTVAPSSASSESAYSVAALVGKANGGIFKNITNNANVTAPSNANRAAGIVGSVFNDNIVMENCVNNGSVTGNIGGARYYSMGGVIGLIGYNDNSNAYGVKAILIDCVNTGTITNNSTDTVHSYAGGVMGNKYVHETEAILIDCQNTGTVRATAYYGNYYAVSTNQNVHVLKSTPIANVDDFMAIQGKRAYRLTADITLSAINGNDFSGIIVGDGHTVTTNDALFANPTTYELYGVETNVGSYNIDGRALSSFAVIAATTSDASAKLIVDHVKSAYGITLSVKTPSANYNGNAILINQNHTYGNTRYGFDYGTTENGAMHIYLDAPSANIQALVNNFIYQKLTTNKTAYDFFENFGQKRFTYEFGSATSQGITYNEHHDNLRFLAGGVTFIDRTYYTSTGIALETSILILAKDANAHLEIAAAPIVSVSSCANGNSAKCNNKHVENSARKDIVEFAQELDASGKNVLASMNGNYFMLSAKCYGPWGMQIVNGKVNNAPYASSYAFTQYWLGVTKDGTPHVGDVASYNSTYKGQIYNGIGGQGFFINNGVFKSGVGSDGKDARSAIGYTENGDIIMVTISGNNENTSHPGATSADISQVFMDLDMDVKYLMGLDSGGSTSMAYKNTEGQYIVCPQYGASGNTKVSMRKLADAIVIVAN